MARQHRTLSWHWLVERSIDYFLLREKGLIIFHIPTPVPHQVGQDKCFGRHFIMIKLHFFRQYVPSMN